MICLGIETTAHTFGAGIVKEEDGKAIVLANVKDVYTTTEGGIVPAEAAKHHVEVCDRVLKDALAKANVKIKDVDLISYSQSPGIGHTLRIGAGAARAIAILYDKPLVGVNHCIAHLEIGRALTEAKDPVLLYASGANTQIIAYEGGKYRVFGETLDCGIGNFLDSFARELGLGFPGGPKLEAMAKDAKKFIAIPYVVKGMDISFGGILTNIKQKLRSGKFTKEDIAFSVQETAFAMLLEVSERAMAHCGKNELLLGGGVACNKRLQEMARKMCEERGSKCFILPNEFNVDNGAMIAWQGILEYKCGRKVEPSKSDVKPYLRTDDIEVCWR
jgi:N6-L-threonylcarbamoyladenine synthase